MAFAQNNKFFLYKGSADPNSVALSPLPKNGNFYYNYNDQQVFIYFSGAGWISLSVPRISEPLYPITVKVNDAYIKTLADGIYIHNT
jgi:hypothetical protein